MPFEEEPSGNHHQRGYATVLLVDTSYVVFAKYYSALNWYKMSINRNPETSGLYDSAVFQNKFEDMFNASIDRVVDACCSGHGRTLVVFAKDCPRSSVWRRAHFPEYKEGRAQNGNFNSEAFGKAYSEVIPRRIARLGGCVIGTAGAEADDVIAVACRRLAESRPGLAVVVLTNDNDYIQLADEARLVNLLHQDVGARRGALSPERYLRYRILSGDRSDNIPSIVPRCGPKTAARLANEHGEEALRRLYGEDNYSRNDTLMNLRKIPEEISDRIVSALDSILLELDL